MVMWGRERRCFEYKLCDRSKLLLLLSLLLLALCEIMRLPTWKSLSAAPKDRHTLPCSRLVVRYDRMSQAHPVSSRASSDASVLNPRTMAMPR